MRAAVGTALVLAAATGAVWGERAVAWIDDSLALGTGGQAEPREGSTGPGARSERAVQPAVVSAAAVSPPAERPGASDRDKDGSSAARGRTGGEPLEWERIVREVERRNRPQPPRHPVAGPFDYGELGAEFGAQRAGHTHEGQDIFAPAGTPLLAVRDGVVVEAGSDAGRGNHIAIYNEEADQTYVYFHMLAPAEAAVGDRVEAGERVGALGCTGSCYGDHLHFELHAGKGAEAPAVDPMPLLERLTR